MILDLFRQMAECYIDTYIIVLLTVENICGRRIIPPDKQSAKLMALDKTDLPEPGLA